MIDKFYYLVNLKLNLIIFQIQIYDKKPLNKAFK